MNKSAVLLSGGMDSIALSYWKKPNFAITVNYGQKPAQAEIQAAIQVSKTLNMEHHIINVDCSSLGSGDLNGTEALNIAPISEWWPYRNQLIITLASMKCVALGVDTLYIGSVKSDSNHKDGTPSFYNLLSETIKYQEGGLILQSPAIELSTAELIRKIKLPRSLLMWAHSCHTSNQPCMSCNGCQKYLYVLQELEID